MDVNYVSARTNSKDQKSRWERWTVHKVDVGQDDRKWTLTMYSREQIQWAWTRERNTDVMDNHRSKKRPRRILIRAGGWNAQLTAEEKPGRLSNEME